MSQLYDIFISYGRADSTSFVMKLYQHLCERDYDVWLDKKNIPLGVDFLEQIKEDIGRANTFIFVITPYSVNSPYCLQEIKIALANKKRIIPLLYLEEIDYQLWKTLNPGKTSDEWQAFQSQGLHSSLSNMHPEICKINWIYFREDLDNFAQSLTHLTNVLNSHADYVKQHTVLLQQALTWQREHKQNRYLLAGKERQQAEKWLQRKFTNTLPPCEPTEIQCEFICESIKNANNLMTQVFLAYSEEERPFVRMIRKALLRQGITVGARQTDIQTGERFQEAIARGIEQTDNVICLLSPSFLKSTYCQLEIANAQKLNKRIIPLLVAPIDLESLPESLRLLQFIDFTDGANETDYQKHIDALIKVVRHEATYYREHKQLLTKALKWEQQKHNLAILLRGYNLQRAEDWLKTAIARRKNPSTSLQEEFIRESLQQPPIASLDVFISYSRADSDLARRLNNELQIRGKTTWFDQESIASGDDFQKEIHRGIENCENFIFILSPESVNSKYCACEVGYAAKLDKRFITILHRKIDHPWRLRLTN